MDLKSKKILIAGAGISGIGAAALLGKAGIPAAIYDGNEALDQKAVVAKLPEGMGKWIRRWSGDESAGHWQLRTKEPLQTFQKVCSVQE